jgi:hypothetical protein
LEEDVPDDIADIANITGHDATNAIAGALLGLPEVEERRVDGKVLATEGERDGGDGVTGNGEEALAKVVSCLRTGDGVIDLGDSLAVTDDLEEKEKKL